MTPALHSQLYDELPTCESTQDEVRQILTTATDPRQLHWVLTQTQTRGRGRQRSLWKSSADKDAQLIVSVGFKNENLDRLGPIMSLVAGQALYTAIQNLGVIRPGDLFLKWPNDLYAFDDEHAPAKIAGILCERHPKQGTVVGFGVNLLWNPEVTGKASTHLLPYIAGIPNEELRLRLLQSLIVEFQSSLSDYLEHPQTFAMRLTQTLRDGSMAPFLQLKNIRVMEQNIQPLHLRDDGTLDALSLDSGQRIRLQ